jgi:hypothetical protein
MMSLCVSVRRGLKCPNEKGRILFKGQLDRTRVGRGCLCARGVEQRRFDDGTATTREYHSLELPWERTCRLQ